MTLPRKRPRTKPSYRPQLVWPRHRRFVRSFGCSVPGCAHYDEPIEFAHVRSAANSGVGVKPHDCFGLSLCRFHHREQHQIGQKAFAEKHEIDLFQMAAEFTRKSPDKAMRDSLKLMEVT
jgi:hypothetical protein